MKATKEAARAAKTKLAELAVSMPSHTRDECSENIKFLEDFIDAATSRLPTETAVSKDRLRKRTKKKVAA